LVRIPEPYDFELSTSRYRLFGSDGATVWHDGGLHRVVAGRERRIVAATGGAGVEPAGAEAQVDVARLLGLPLQVEPFLEWAAKDGILGAVTAQLRGFRPPLNPEPFEALVIGITTQQISLRAAAAIRGRFVERFGVRHEVAWEFPTRERIAGLEADEITAIGFSRSKAAYVVALARSDLDFVELDGLPDEDVIAAVTAQPGLGRWTADWFLARHLARPHAWPAGDLGLRKAVGTFYADGRFPSIQEVRAMGERFAPFQNLTAQFLLMGARMVG
jgi:DNA-3-methyladenine glycosylase II